MFTHLSMTMIKLKIKIDKTIHFIKKTSGFLIRFPKTIQFLIYVNLTYLTILLKTLEM